MVGARVSRESNEKEQRAHSARSQASAHSALAGWMGALSAHAKIVSFLSSSRYFPQPPNRILNFWCAVGALAIYSHANDHTEYLVWQVFVQVHL